MQSRKRSKDVSNNYLRVVLEVNPISYPPIPLVCVLSDIERMINSWIVANSDTFLSYQAYKCFNEEFLLNVALAIFCSGTELTIHRTNCFLRSQ